MKLRSAVFVILAILMMLTYTISPVPAKATADNTPPALISCTPSKTSFSSGEDVVYDLKVYDQSGIEYISLSLVNIDREDLFVVFLENIVDTGTPEEKGQGIYSYRFSASVNDNFDSGNYKVHYVLARDKAGNGYPIYGSEFIHNSINITNTVRTDFHGPEIVSFEMDKTNVSVGETVNFTIRASDPADIGHGYVKFQDPQGNLLYKTAWMEQIGDDNSLWKASFPVNAFTKNGLHTVDSIDIWDKLGNCATRTIINKQFYVSNPNYSPGAPTVEKITLSKQSVKPGDTVRIEAKIDAKGTLLNDYVHLYLQRPNFMNVQCIDLYRNQEGNYSIDWTVPAKFQADELNLSVYIWEDNGLVWSYFGSCNGYVFPKMNIESVFSGLDDRSVLVGSAFDPMAGVSASNVSEGNMTDKILLEGSVNTNQPGLYLLRYKIKSNQTIGYGDNEIPVYYFESRWIGVTEIMPDNTVPDAPLALTNDALQIGAQSADVLVQRNGQSVSYSNAYTEPGVYTVSEKSATTAYAVDLESRSNGNAHGLDDMTVKESSALSTDSVSGVIDRSGPNIAATWVDTGLPIVVSVNVSDVSGVASLKYKAGACSLDDCKYNGIDFSGSFTALDYGHYTLYAQDRFGYESLKVFDIAKATAPSPPHVGTFTSKKVPSKANVGTVITIVPPAAPKGYTMRSFSYSSNKPSVATVDENGNVTFIGGGKVTIIIRVVSQTVDKRGRVRTRTTTVKKNITVNQAVESISLNLADTTVARTQKVKLTTAFAPATASNKKVKWTTSNNKIATVSSSGVVTGKAGGIAVITCTARDGSGASASCTVTVTPINPTGLKLSKTALNVKVGKTTSFKATVLPKKTDFRTVTFVSSDPAIAAVDAKGKIKALAPGTVTITATTSNGLSASCTVTVH